MRATAALSSTAKSRGSDHLRALPVRLGLRRPRLVRAWAPIEARPRQLADRTKGRVPPTSRCKFSRIGRLPPLRHPRRRSNSTACVNDGLRRWSPAGASSSAGRLPASAGGRLLAITRIEDRSTGNIDSSVSFLVSVMACWITAGAAARAGVSARGGASLSGKSPEVRLGHS